MKIKDILNEMNKIAPITLMQKGDNSGLLVGDPEREAKKVLAALDITNEAVDEARKKGADVIISHHPVIYDPLYSLSEKNPACRAAKHGIFCICYHSPLDLAHGGMNDIIFDILKLPLGLLKPQSFLEEVGGGYGYGLICGMKTSLSPEETARLLKSAFGCTAVRYSRGGRPIKTIAFCSGSGGSMFEDALSLGADALITGDVKHDRMIAALNEGATIFDCGHFHTENIVLPYIAKKFAEDIPDLPFEIAESSVDPCAYIVEG